MNIEIEERVLDIDVEKIIAKLETLGATKVGEWHQKRYVYDFNPVRENEWIRLRTNGEKVTLTYKNIEDVSLTGTKELEVEVEDFEKTNELLNILGYMPKAFQENKRIRYLLEGTEVDIDFWPLIPAYLEIEGSRKSIDGIEAGVREIQSILAECQRLTTESKVIFDRIDGAN